MLKARDLREETVEELEKRVGELREQLFKLRFQQATGQVDDVRKLGNVRRDLARVLTIMNEKQSRSAVQEGS
jgi:large subunit ribosomal protein L29